MKKLICCVMAFIMLLSVNVVFAKTDENIEPKTKNLSKELNKKLDFSIKLNELNDLEKLTSQVQENGDIITDNELSKTNLEFEVNKKGDGSELLGKLIINNKEYVLKGEGTVKTYDVIGEDDYMFGEYFGWVYKNGKPVREFGMTFEYTIADQEYIYSSISLLPASKDEDKGSSMNLSFGNANKNMNNMFFEKYIFNQENDELSIVEKTDKNAEDSVSISAVVAPPMTTNYTLNGRITSTSTAPLMYMAGYNESTLKSNQTSYLCLRAWTKTANIEKYLAFKNGYPVNAGTTKPIESKFEIYNGTNVSIISYLPKNSQTSITIPVPYNLGSWTWLDLTLITSSTKVTQPNYNSMICTYGAPAGLKNTDATTTTPWNSSTKCGMAVQAYITTKGTVISSELSSIGWKASYKYQAVLNKLGVYTYIYETLSATKNTNIKLVP